MTRSTESGRASAAASWTGLGGLDLLSDGFMQDPFPAYRWLLENEPVRRSESGFWTVFRFEDVWALLRDERLSSRFSSRSFHAPRFADVHVTAGVTQSAMSSMDAPEHTLLRSLFDAALTPRSVREFEPRIETVVDEVVDELARTIGPGGSFDFVSTIADQVPARCLSAMLGLPDSDRERIGAWARALLYIFDPMPAPDTVAQLNHAVEEVTEYLEEVLFVRYRDPGPDLISELLAARHDGLRLSERDIISSSILVLAAGERTAAYTLGLGMHALLEAPEQLALLQERPELWPSAVEELLRLVGPAQVVSRTALADIDLAGHVIPAGEPVMLVNAAANRDPREFDEPDRLDVTREIRRHVGFGGGRHYCAGALLARIETRLALSKLLERFPNIRLERAPDYTETVFLRGVKRLELNAGS